MDESASEVQALRTELEALRAEVREMRGRRKRTTDTKSPADDVDEDLSSRRGFLRMAGGAAIAGLIAAVGGKAEPAEAATGGALLMGVGSQTVDDISHHTRMYSPSGTTLMPRTLQMDNYSSSGSFTPPATQAIAIVGDTTGPDSEDKYRVGIYGRAGKDGDTNDVGTGVFGTSSAGELPWVTERFGVMGMAPNAGTGVLGYCPVGASAIGVNGRADEGTGVVGLSASGISIDARGTGRFKQDLQTASGAPTSGTYALGEMIRDLVGEMYICVTSGTPGSWRKVTATHPSYANSGGSINMLSKPIRVLDTRPGQGAPLGNAGPLAAATGYALQITGTSVGGIYVPAGAKGILGNLTVTQFAGPGNAVVYPDGVTQPTASNINFTSPTATIAVANNFICGLSAAGKLKIWSSVATHAIIDIAGFVY